MHGYSLRNTPCFLRLIVNPFLTSAQWHLYFFNSHSAHFQLYWAKISCRFWKRTQHLSWSPVSAKPSHSNPLSWLRANTYKQRPPNNSEQGIGQTMVRFSGSFQMCRTFRSHIYAVSIKKSISSMMRFESRIRRLFPFCLFCLPFFSFFKCRRLKVIYRVCLINF